MAKRRHRQSAEGTFLEQVMGRLSALEKLIAELHWTTVGHWQFVEPAMDCSFCEPLACNEESSDQHLFHQVILQVQSRCSEQALDEEIDNKNVNEQMPVKHKPDKLKPDEVEVDYGTLANSGMGNLEGERNNEVETEYSKFVSKGTGNLKDEHADKIETD